MSRALLSHRESREGALGLVTTTTVTMLLIMLYHTTLPLVLTGASWYLGSSWYHYATLFLCCKMLVFDRIGYSSLLWHFCSITPVISLH